MNSKILQETSLRYFFWKWYAVAQLPRHRLNSMWLHLRSVGNIHLESNLNVLLFERKARGMKPTSAGEILAAYALKLLSR